MASSMSAYGGGGKKLISLFIFSISFTTILAVGWRSYSSWSLLSSPIFSGMVPLSSTLISSLEVIRREKWRIIVDWNHYRRIESVRSTFWRPICHHTRNRPNCSLSQSTPLSHHNLLANSIADSTMINKVPVGHPPLEPGKSGSTRHSQQSQCEVLSWSKALNDTWLEVVAAPIVLRNEWWSGLRSTPSSAISPGG